HVMYVSPVKRGNGIEIIEDSVPLYNVKVSVKTLKAPKRVYLAPEMTELAYEYDAKSGVVSYVIEKLDMRAMVVIDY
nr:beta-galactosidase [Clostridia bacterium]